ncbi:exported hypothetical protein [Actinacidiphila cocklensis]|uniref:Uncharacterized protein n=1 Tax=Actinacidiphila cocklensis TaxID=887465 RepID=A0A9W4DNA0_9ACTN|nr:exported hypothetical protein [Actinacidiphila cocklensis]
MVCAAWTGVRSAGSSAPVPSVTRSVTAASAASAVSASSRGVSRESVVHSESKPVRSARTPKATASRGSVCSLHWAFVLGTKTPIRTVSPEASASGAGPSGAGPVPSRVCVVSVNALVMPQIVSRAGHRLNSRQGMAAAHRPG